MAKKKDKQKAPGQLWHFCQEMRTEIKENLSKHSAWEWWVDTVAVTFFTLLLTWFLFNSNITGDLFSSAAEIDTPELIDLYSASAHQTGVPHYNDIMLLSIEGCSRQDIATAIEILNEMDPRVIGVDVVFPYPAEGDEILRDALLSNNKIVMASIPSNGTYFEQTLREQGVSFGSVVFDVDSRYNIVRSFTPMTKNGNDTIWSFDWLLAQKAGAPAGCFLPYEKSQYILYSNLMMDTLACQELISPSADLAKYAEQIKDKIILIGDVKTASDFYRTPIEANMPGLLIHAYILDTIIRGEIIEVSPTWLNWLAAILISIIFSVAMLFFKWGCDDAEGLVLRVTQILLMILVVVIGVIKFYLCHKYFDFVPTFFALAIQAVVLDIWVGLMEIAKHFINPNESNK